MISTPGFLCVRSSNMYTASYWRWSGSARMDVCTRCSFTSVTRISVQTWSTLLMICWLASHGKICIATALRCRLPSSTMRYTMMFIIPSTLSALFSMGRRSSASVSDSKSSDSCQSVSLSSMSCLAHLAPTGRSDWYWHCMKSPSLSITYAPGCTYSPFRKVCNLRAARWSSEICGATSLHTCCKVCLQIFCVALVCIEIHLCR